MGSPRGKDFSNKAASDITSRLKGERPSLHPTLILGPSFSSLPSLTLLSHHQRGSSALHCCSLWPFGRAAKCQFTGRYCLHLSADLCCSPLFLRRKMTAPLTNTWYLVIFIEGNSVFNHTRPGCGKGPYKVAVIMYEACPIYFRNGVWKFLFH